MLDLGDEIGINQSHSGNDGQQELWPSYDI